MTSLQAGTRNELLLMLYRRKTLFFFLASALVPIFLAVSFNALQSTIGLLTVSQSFPIQMLELYTMFMIPLFFFLAISDLFPQEISSRTLKLALLRPISRFGAFAAKILALGAAIAALLVLLAVVTLACSVLMGSAGMATIDWFGYGKAYAAGFLSMWALSSVFVFVSQFFRSANGFLVFAIVLYAAAKFAPFFVKGFSAFSLASYTDWYLLWLSHSVSSGKLMTSLLFVLSGFMLFITLGYMMFDRKEA
ncbi:ABC transporter permease [Cohnella silvisoli]|uniref:ABC transporter permease n=1 Tax=Cohnella silvisoli TaxID=2873699 RepID=A0ABV1KSY7_9BACL|nr:ABC transporter permease [Cohnella silvisoli]MCD9021482.1 ABC transporter permease [Cohnella silvisoli]